MLHGTVNSRLTDLIRIPDFLCTLIYFMSSTHALMIVLTNGPVKNTLAPVFFLNNGPVDSTHALMIVLTNGPVKSTYAPVVFLSNGPVDSTHALMIVQTNGPVESTNALIIVLTNALLRLQMHR